MQNDLLGLSGAWRSMLTGDEHAAVAARLDGIERLLDEITVQLGQLAASVREIAAPGYAGSETSPRYNAAAPSERNAMGGIGR